MKSTRSQLANIRPFKTDKQIASFAAWFLKSRAQGFSKDINICLTASESGNHAYLPALFTCISFLDLLAGLYAGNVNNHSRKEFLKYCADFLDSQKYAPSNLAILYEGFRHKLAHLSQPYPVFDTKTKPSLSLPPKRIAWSIYAARRSRPLELLKYDPARVLRTTTTPWPVPYDHRLSISVRAFATDARKTLIGREGYIQKIRDSADLRTKFAECMKLFYPQ